jgi:O-antigen ligase
MDYFLFLLVNAVLFLRPAELVPDLERLPLYFWFILACLIVSIPKLFGLLSPDSPLRHPVTLCVFGIFGFVALSHLAQSDLDKMGQEAFEFLKVVVYFVLFLALVNTPGKLRWLLTCVILFGVIITSVAVLEYHEMIEHRALRTADEFETDPDTGQQVRVARLMVTGILHDPNEFCVFLGVLSLLTLHQVSNVRLGLARVLWLAPLALFLYGVYLTKSRGGLLALLVGLATVSILTYGLRRTLAYGLLAVPLLLVAFAGRQTSISVSEGTGRARLELWSDWMMKFRGSPVFGEGPKITEAMTVDRKEMHWDYQQVAHNSYLQAFADLGVLGGMIFLGAFFFAFRTMARLRGDQVAILDPEQRRLYPFLFGALTAYMTGMMSLSLCYVLPTYFVLALPVVFTRQTATEPSVEEVRIDGYAVRQVVVASVGMLAFIYLFIKVFRA